MPDTGMFYLYEVGCRPFVDSPKQVTSIDFVRASCNRCRRVFYACDPPHIKNIAEGGAVLRCPACGNHQAISIARFEEFVARFSNGHVEMESAAFTPPKFTPDASMPLRDE